MTTCSFLKWALCVASTSPAQMPDSPKFIFHNSSKQVTTNARAHRFWMKTVPTLHTDNRFTHNCTRTEAPLQSSLHRSQTISIPLSTWPPSIQPTTDGWIMLTNTTGRQKREQDKRGAWTPDEERCSTKLLFYFQTHSQLHHEKHHRQARLQEMNQDWPKVEFASRRQSVSSIQALYPA